MGERKKEKKDQTNIFTCENQWDNKREREREREIERERTQEQL